MYIIQKRFKLFWILHITKQWYEFLLFCIYWIMDRIDNEPDSETHFTLISFRFKLMKWWSQSYLVGIPRVVAGFRDMDGHVHTLKTYHVNEMPHMAQVFWIFICIFIFHLTLIFLFYRQSVIFWLIKYTIVRARI